MIRIFGAVVFFSLSISPAASAQAQPSISSYTVDGCTYKVGISKTPCPMGPGSTLVVNGTNFGDVGGLVSTCDCPQIIVPTGGWTNTRITGYVYTVSANYPAGIQVETASGLWSDSGVALYTALPAQITQLTAGDCTYIPSVSAQPCVITPNTQFTLYGNYFGRGPLTSGPQLVICDCANPAIQSWDTDWTSNPAPTGNVIVATATEAACGNAVTVWAEQFSTLGSNPVPYTTGTDCSTVLWRGTAETGAMSDWTKPGGGEFDSGGGSSSASQDFSHSGSWSYKMMIGAPAPGGHSSATRLFRWAESQANRDSYYSIWLYFPADFGLTGNLSNGHFLNLFQFKSRTYDGSRNDPLWAIYLINDCSDANSHTACLTGSTKYLQLGWGSGGTAMAGPYATSDVSPKEFHQTDPNRVALPIGSWTHLEAFLHQSTAAGNTSPSNYDGQITVWQDGVLLWNLTDIATSYPNCNVNSWCAVDQWSVNNYSDSVNNGAAFVIYSDDGQISSAYVP